MYVGVFNGINFTLKRGSSRLKTRVLQHDTKHSSCKYEGTSCYCSTDGLREHGYTILL